MSAGSEYLEPAELRTDGAPVGSAGDFTTKTWRNWSIVRIMYPGIPYSIWAMFASATGEFRRWYVNIERPFARTEIGFDVVDYELDVVAERDLDWEWKDEEHLARMVSEGLFTSAEARQFRSHGLDAVSRIESRSAPFDESWPGWRPPPSWGPLKMPSSEQMWSTPKQPDDQAT